RRPDKRARDVPQSALSPSDDDHVDRSRRDGTHGKRRRLALLVGPSPRSAMSSAANSVAGARVGTAAAMTRWSAWNTAAVRTAICVAAFALVALALGLHVWRILAVPGIADDSHAGLIDFRDQAYYPVRALLDGNNPYDAARFVGQYPAVKVFAPYS